MRRNPKRTTPTVDQRAYQLAQDISELEAAQSLLAQDMNMLTHRFNLLEEAIAAHQLADVEHLPKAEPTELLH
jgi:hypothetical protein